MNWSASLQHGRERLDLAVNGLGLPGVAILARALPDNAVLR